MTKEFNQYTETKFLLLRLASLIKSTLPSNKGEVPHDIQEKIEDFLYFLETYKVEGLRPQPTVLTGELFNVEKTLREIVQASGYNWTIKEIFLKEELENYSLTFEDIQRIHGVIPHKYKVFSFNRGTDSRDELYLIRLVLLPGHAFMQWSTGRVSGITKMNSSIESLILEIYKLTV